MGQSRTLLTPPTLTPEQREDGQRSLLLLEIPNCDCVIWTPCNCPDCWVVEEKDCERTFEVTFNVANLVGYVEEVLGANLIALRLLDTEIVIWKSQPWNCFDNVTLSRTFAQPIHDQDPFLTPPCQHVLDADHTLTIPQWLRRLRLYRPDDNGDPDPPIPPGAILAFARYRRRPDAALVAGDRRAAYLMQNYGPALDKLFPPAFPLYAVLAYWRYKGKADDARKAGDLLGATLIEKFNAFLTVTMPAQVVTREDRVRQLYLRAHPDLDAQKAPLWHSVKLWNGDDVIHMPKVKERVGLRVRLTEGNNRPRADELVIEMGRAPDGDEWDEEEVADQDDEDDAWDVPWLTVQDCESWTPATLAAWEALPQSERRRVEEAIKKAEPMFAKILDDPRCEEAIRKTYRRPYQYFLKRRAVTLALQQGLIGGAA